MQANKLDYCVPSCKQLKRSPNLGQGTHGWFTVKGGILEMLILFISNKICARLFCFWLYYIYVVHLAWLFLRLVNLLHGNCWVVA